MSQKLKPGPKKGISYTDKIARVDSSEVERIDAEYFRACLHHFDWTLPQPRQLQKCFTKRFSKAIFNNATAANLSGQCFLAFVVHEAKKFLKDDNIRTTLWNLELCLRAILKEKVAETIFQAIGDEDLPVGRELGRTQCLHDQPFPQWISVIADKVLLHPHLSTSARQSLALLLGRLDLQSSLRLSDAARQWLASGPWPKRYIRIAHTVARRRTPHTPVTRTRLSKPPSPVRPPPTIPTQEQIAAALFIDDDSHRDMISRIYSSDVAREHQEAIQTTILPTPRMQVFRNGAPHSLYATEALLREVVSELESRYRERRANQQMASVVASTAVEIGSTSSGQSREARCILNLVKIKSSRLVHRFRRSKSEAQPPLDRVTRHRGSPKEQEEALKQLQKNILELQRRKKLFEDQEKWIQENRPRLASVAIPSLEAAQRSWEAQHARSPNLRARHPGAFASLRGGASREQSQSRNQEVTRISSDDPPTYAESERARQPWRDAESPSLGSKLSQSLKRMLWRMRIKKKSASKDPGVSLLRPRTRSPRG